MDTKLKGMKSRSRNNNGFKLKIKYKRHSQTNNKTVEHIFREIGFKLEKEGPDLYMKTIE